MKMGRNRAARRSCAADARSLRHHTVHSNDCPSTHQSTHHTQVLLFSTYIYLCERAQVLYSSRTNITVRTSTQAFLWPALSIFFSKERVVSRRDPGLRLIFVLSFILVFSQAVLLSHVRLFSSSYTYWPMDSTLFHPCLFITYWLIWISQLRMNTHRLFWRHAWHLRFICIFTLQYDTLFWQRLPHYYSASQ